MSQTQTQISLIEFMRSYIEKASTTYMSDLERTPKDKLAETPESPKKPEIDFITDCTEENMEIAHILRGEKYSLPCYEGAKSAHHSVDEYSKLTADLVASTNDLLAAIEAVGDKGLSAAVMSPEGETLPAFRLATRAANHMKYHDLYTGLARPS
jgi:hypothetical protein